MDTIPTNVTAERGKDDNSAAGAAPVAPVQAATLAAHRVIAWEQAGKMVDGESMVQAAAPIIARAYVELKTILPPHLFALTSEAEKAADKETYDQKRREELDAPDDCEVWLTFGTLRKIERVFATVRALRAAIAKTGG